MSTFILPKSSKNLFQSIFTQELCYLVQLFKENKFDIKVAGGAVRDILMDITPHDVDFATDATPSEMKTLFEKHHIRLINTNGESHGTITPRINDKENFEITTLRIDRVTDGRRAEVEFTKDWKIDAERRDLTINSMFLDMDGVVHDYFNGEDDIRMRIVRFVGDPRKRIQEDYLRILRYFRFYGRIAKNPDEHIYDTIQVIRENRSGLQQVSGERVWMELRKILCGNFVPEILEKMNHCEILSLLGLPENPDFTELRNRFEILKRNDCHPAVVLSTFLKDHKQLSTAFARLKFSKDDLTYAIFMIKERDTLAAIPCASHSDLLQYCKDEYIMHNGDPPQMKLKLCFIEYFKYIDRIDLVNEFQEWESPKFPLRGDVLSRLWNVKGKRLGSAMQFLRQEWKKTNYTASCEDLIGNPRFKEEFFRKTDI